MPITRNGFTLIELMIAVSIIALISVAAFVNVGAFRKDQELQSATNDLQAFIRVAQANATSNTTCPSTCPANDICTSPSWFVEFKDPDTVYLKCLKEDNIPPVKAFYHNTNIQISKIDNSSSCFPTNIKFTPLYGTITFEPGGGNLCSIISKTSIPVVLYNTNGQSTTAINTVVIDKGGSVYVQNSAQ